MRKGVPADKDLVRMPDARCPHCSMFAGLRVGRKFRDFVNVLMEAAGIFEIPDGVALTFQCRRCRELSSIEIIDLLYEEVDSQE